MLILEQEGKQTSRLKWDLVLLWRGGPLPRDHHILPLLVEVGQHLQEVTQQDKPVCVQKEGDLKVLYLGQAVEGAPAVLHGEKLLNLDL